MKRGDKIYGIGIIAALFGGAGIAEHVCSGRGSFLISTIVFSIGFGLILMSYTYK